MQNNQLCKWTMTYIAFWISWKFEKSPSKLALKQSDGVHDIVPKLIMQISSGAFASYDDPSPINGVFSPLSRRFLLSIVYIWAREEIEWASRLPDSSSSSEPDPFSVFFCSSKTFRFQICSKCKSSKYRENPWWGVWNQYIGWKTGTCKVETARQIWGRGK